MVWNTTLHYRWYHPPGWWTHYPGPPSYSESGICLERWKCSHNHDGKTELAKCASNGCPTVFNHNRKQVEWPTVLIICSAMPGKGMSSWHEWWLEMSLDVITSKQNRNRKVSSGSFQSHHHQKSPRPSTQVQGRLCWRYSLTKMAPSDRLPAAWDDSECPALLTKMTTLRQVTKSKWSGKLTHGVIQLHDIARPHMANTIMALLQKFKWEVLGRPPYSSDLSPCD